MAAACATAMPVDILADATPWAPQPRSEMSSRGSDISSEGAQSEESTPDQQHPPSRQAAPQHRLDKSSREGNDTGFDLRLATRLVELMGVEVRLSITHALGERFSAKPREVDRAVRMLFKCLRLLRDCGYPSEDIEVLFSHASAYMRAIMSRMRRDGQPDMGLHETVHIMCVLIYLAHTHCEDQNCPTHIWHKHLFQRYCTLRTLNAAILGLLDRLEWRLRVEDSEMEAGLSFLRKGGQPPIFVPVVGDQLHGA